jgi:hypothetical protein
VLLPVFVVLGGIGILQATVFKSFPDLQLSTAYYNAQGCVGAQCARLGGCFCVRVCDVLSRSRSCPNPCLCTESGGACLNRMPALVFKSGVPGDPYSVDVASWITAIPSANVTHADPTMLLDGTALDGASDPNHLITSSLQVWGEKQQSA